jgi:hypothetical protein
MKAVRKTDTPSECRTFPLVTPEVTEEDTARFFHLISVELEGWQVDQILSPQTAHPRQEDVLAVHWHPEFVPMDLIHQRVDKMFPNRNEELLIPTQHNEILSYNGYSGVEVDCYASGFNRKVQLLLHFTNDKVKNADVLRAMLSHTFTYRSSQLFEFMDTITTPFEERIQTAAAATGADEDLIEFVRANVAKIHALLDEHWSAVPAVSIKNKLLRNWFDTLRGEIDSNIINRVQAYLKAIKKLVKKDFSLKYFYRASEIIEETRALGGCVVIPHPEQFWPILLAGYDVDGIEVWNPQSQEYTAFLISVVTEHNRRQGARRKQLIFMGDDCHMGEKTKPIPQQNTEKASREIGYQPAWEDLSIRKRYIVHGISRSRTIKEYKDRLHG